MISGMGERKEVRLGDIARELNISIVTVSNALKDKKGVSSELRMKIKEKARAMGYDFARTAPRKEAESYCVGVMIAERYVKEFPSFYMDVYKQIAQVMARKGSLTLLEIIDAEKEKLKYTCEFFPNMKIDGLIFLGEMRMDFIRAVRKTKKVPAVGVDFYSLEEDMDYIVSDSLHGMERVTQKLIDAGHRDIMFVGNPYATKNIMDRYMGYCKALLINGIEESKDGVIPDRENGETSYIIDFELPEKIPQAFAVNCDKAAFLLIEKLRKRGLSVPKDVSVVGFDHTQSPMTGDIALTTYESDQKALAQISVHTLLKKIVRKDGEDTTAMGIQIVEGRLIEGNTIKERAGRKR